MMTCISAGTSLPWWQLCPCKCLLCRMFCLVFQTSVLCKARSRWRPCRSWWQRHCPTCCRRCTQRDATNWHTASSVSENSALSPVSSGRWSTSLSWCGVIKLTFRHCSVKCGRRVALCMIFDILLHDSLRSSAVAIYPVLLYIVWGDIPGVYLSLFTCLD